MHPAPRTLEQRGKLMTVGIGLVCGSGKYILLGADTRGSYGNVTSNDEMAKMFDLPAYYFGVMAGVGSYCTDVIAELYHRMKKIPDAEIAPEQARQCIRESYQQVYIESAKEALLNGPRITWDQYLYDRKIVPKVRRQAENTLRSIEINGSLIVAGFYQGQPVQFVAAPDFNDPAALIVAPEITPGNAVIGSGSTAALNWLNYRKQNIHFGLAHSLLHLTEAKQFAEVEKTVGPLRHAALLWPGGCKPLDWTEDAQKLMQGWWRNYGLLLSDNLEDESYNKAVRDTFGLGATGSELASGSC